MMYFHGIQWGSMGLKWDFERVSSWWNNDLMMIERGLNGVWDLQRIYRLSWD